MSAANFNVGRMVNVPPGLMRNKLYGRKWAVYVTPTELEELGSKKNVAPPDTAFGRRKTLKPESITSTPPKKKKPLTLQRSASKPKLELDLLTVLTPQFFHKSEDKIC